MALLLWAGPGLCQTTGNDPDPQAYATLSAHAYEYNGPGRDLAEPQDLDEVRIGLFIPTRGDRAAAGLSLRRGAELAVKQANARGGYDGTPFSLVIRPDDFVWGSAREVVKLVYEDRVWAVAGAVGGQSTHIAQQIITKAQVPLLGVATTDASLTQINIPWMFRLMPDDDAVARTLAAHLVRTEGYTAIAAVASTAYDSRLRAEAFEQWAQRLGAPLRLSLRYNPGDQYFDKQLHLLTSATVQAVVVWGDAAESIRLVKQLCQQLPEAHVFGGPGLAMHSELELSAGCSAGLTLVTPCDLWRHDPHVQTFADQYSQLYGTAPDLVAAYAFDGMQLLIAAVHSAGLNRARIRDALAEMQPYAGITGEIRFDGSGSNTAPPVLLKGSRLRPHHEAAF